jgi:hypothetical protein
MPTQPLFEYTAARFESDLYYSCGDQWPNPLDGTQPFSIGGWFRLTAENENAVFLSKTNEFQFGANLSQITATFLSGTVAAATVFTGAPSLDLNVWHYLLFTYGVFQQTIGGEVGYLFLYVDGNPAATPIKITSIVATRTTNNSMLFGNADFDCLNLSIWNARLLPPIPPSWLVQGPAQNLVAAYDFTVIPPADNSGNNMPLVPSGEPPFTAVLASGLTLNSGTYGLPSPTDSLNPGSGGNPFTVHAWLSAQAPNVLVPGSAVPLCSNQLAIFSNGQFSGSANLVISLLYDTTLNNFTLTVQLGGATGATLSASQAFNPEEWHHVAATYDGSSVLTAYLDGQPVGSATVNNVGTIPVPSPVLGACADSTAPNGMNYPFNGEIQSLGIWPTCLNQQQIQIYMTTPPDASTGCLAFFDLATEFPINTISGALLALYGGASIGEALEEAAIASMTLPRRPNPVGRGQISPTIFDLKAPAGVDLSVRPKSKVLTDQDIDRVTADFERFLTSIVPAKLQSKHRDAFTRNLHLGIHLHEASGGYVPGTITTSIVGDCNVFYEHTLNGPREIARASVADLDPCVAWLIGIIASAIGFLFLALGAAFTAAAVVNKVLIPYVVQNALGMVTPFRTLFLSTELSAATFIKAAQTIWGLGLLTGVVMQGLADVSWWSWAWTAACFVVQIASLWLTGGLFLIYILAQVAVTYAQFVQLCREKPVGCFS